MTNNKPIAKAGQLLMIDMREYSSYTVMGFFVILKTFDPKEELIKFIATYPKIYGDDYEYKYEQMDEIVPYLIAQGFLLEIEPINLYLGYCGFEIDEMSLKLPGKVD